MSNLDLSKEVLKVDAYHINSVVVVIRRADGTNEKCLINPQDVIRVDAIVTGPVNCCEGHISSPIPALETIEGRVINIMDNKMRLDCSKEYKHEEKVIYIANIRDIDNLTNPQKPEPPKEEEEDKEHPESGQPGTPESKPEVDNPSDGETGKEPEKEPSHEETEENKKPSPDKDTVISSEDGTPILIIK